MEGAGLVDAPVRPTTARRRRRKRPEEVRASRTVTARQGCMSMTQTCTTVDGSAGAIIIHVAFALMALLAFTSFVIDYGVMWVSRAQAQNVADAGALAGASPDVCDGGSPPRRRQQLRWRSMPIWGQGTRPRTSGSFVGSRHVRRQRCHVFRRADQPGACASTSSATRPIVRNAARDARCARSDLLRDPGRYHRAGRSRHGDRAESPPGIR